MADVIRLPAAEPIWHIEIDHEAKPPICRTSTLPSGRTLIIIAARSWQEAEQLRDKAAGALKRGRRSPHMKTGAAISWTQKRTKTPQEHDQNARQEGRNHAERH